MCEGGERGVGTQGHSGVLGVTMTGRGRGGRPREDPTTTTRGIREAKRQQKKEEKERKDREKQEKKRLWREGKCVAPDGSVATMTQVGRQYGELGGAAGREVRVRLGQTESPGGD